MGYDISLRFLARAWLYQIPTLGTAKWLSKLSELLEVELEPRSGLRVDLQRGGVALNTPMLASSTGWQVTLGPESIDVEVVETTGHTMPSREQFMKKSASVLSAVTAASPGQAYRIATVAEGFIQEMPTAAMDDVCRRCLKYPKTFSPAPYEWDWRCVSQVPRTFAGNPEATNAIAIVKRVAGFRVTEKGPENFDRIRVDLDLNTMPTNVAPRLSASAVTSFVTDAAGWLDALEEEVFAFLGVA